MVREFAIVNTVPETNIDFTGVDFTKPQREKIFFNVALSHHKVLPQTLSLIVENASGQKVVTKTTDAVSEKMSISLRTPALANGTYTIYFEGKTPFQGKDVVNTSERRNLMIRN